MTFSPRDYYLLLKLKIIIILTWQGVILSCTVPHAVPHAYLITGGKYLVELAFREQTRTSVEHEGGKS